MEWGVTPVDVRSGKVDYSVAEFREDHLDEIRFNISELRGNDMTKRFHSVMTIMLCTSLSFCKPIVSAFERRFTY
jgi:hypothetical protein